MLSCIYALDTCYVNARSSPRVGLSKGQIQVRRFESGRKAQSTKPITSTLGEFRSVSLRTSLNLLLVVAKLKTQPSFIGASSLAVNSILRLIIRAPFNYD